MNLFFSLKPASTLLSHRIQPPPIKLQELQQDGRGYHLERQWCEAAGEMKGEGNGQTAQNPLGACCVIMADC